MVSFKGFFWWMHQERLIASNVTDIMESPRQPESLPHLLSEPEIDALLSLYSASQDPIKRRNHLIIELLYANGLRVSELTSLKIKDIDSVQRTLRITGKRNKTRIVPFGKSTMQYVRHYMDHYRPLLGKDAPELLLSRYGGRLSTVMVWKILKKMASEAEIDRRVFPHMLRHSFAICSRTALICE